MKQFFTICLFLMSITVLAQQANNENYYYYKGNNCSK